MQIIMKTSDCKIRDNVAFSTIFKSKSWAMTYNSKTKTFFVIRLHLIENQCRILTASMKSIKQTTYSIWNKRFRLLTKKKSMKITICSESRSNWTYFSFFVLLSICHCNRLFKASISSDEKFVDCAAYNKSNDAFDWQMQATYALLTRWARYCCFEISFSLTIPFKLINDESQNLTNCIDACDSWFR